MKRAMTWILALVLTLGLCACGDSSAKWQEQYDLGQKYLTEGNYEEAILAFTAAIEIDPKNALAYIGRGSAYAFSGDTDENLTAAEADFVKAVELDGTNPDAWLGLADVYIRMGDYDRAEETLEKALEALGENEDVSAKLEELVEEKVGITEPIIPSGPSERKNCGETYDSRGRLLHYFTFDADVVNRIYTQFNYRFYDADGNLLQTVEEPDKDSYCSYHAFTGELVRLCETNWTDSDAVVQKSRIDAYDLETEELLYYKIQDYTKGFHGYYEPDGTLICSSTDFLADYYDANGILRIRTIERKLDRSKHYNYWINAIYDATGSLQNYILYQQYTWN